MSSTQLTRCIWLCVSSCRCATFPAVFAARVLEKTLFEEKFISSERSSSPSPTLPPFLLSFTFLFPRVCNSYYSPSPLTAPRDTSNSHFRRYAHRLLLASLPTIYSIPTTIPGPGATPNPIPFSTLHTNRSERTTKSGSERTAKPSPKRARKSSPIPTCLSTAVRP